MRAVNGVEPGCGECGDADHAGQRVRLYDTQACWSLSQDIVPAGRIGTAGGFVHLLANLAGILSPGITGFLIQYGGGDHTAFLLALLVRQKKGVNTLRALAVT